MKSSPARRSGKSSRAAHKRRTSAPKARIERAIVSEPAVRDTAPGTRRNPASSRAEVERLMNQMREANGRLVVAAIQAQNRSDEARDDAMHARVEIDGLMGRLAEANDQLAAAAAEANASAEQAEEREERFRQLSGRLLTLQDEERRRLARDLHDSTAQNLVALTLNLAWIEATPTAPVTELRRVLAECRALADECSRDVRTRAYLLHPPLLDEVGLAPAVRWLVDGFTKRSGVHVVAVLGEIGRLPAPIELALFRVVQESLANVHRHASATAVSIRISTRDNALALEIQDRGRGLRQRRPHRNRERVPGTLGVGIQGMRERIRQLHGTFDIEFTDRGTTVRVGVPLTEVTI